MSTPPTPPTPPSSLNPDPRAERRRRILDQLARWRDGDAPTHGGRVLTYVYDPGIDEVDTLAGEAARAVQPVNGLDPLTFSSVAELERSLVAFGRSILNGGGPGSGVVGSVTSGGTESCLLAVKAARDRAKTLHGVAPGEGVLVLPTTAHAAFLKAAELFELRVRRVPVDPVSTAVRADDIAAALDDITASGAVPVLVVGSAPNYPTGTVDPIAGIGAVTAARGVPLHVDACLGGLILPFWPLALEPWDFRVPGVTSISADTHKYGYAPKGSSLLLHRTAEGHRAQYFATADWPGYPVVNPTLLGSRSATGIASAWAVSGYLTVDGYRELTATVADAVARLTRLIADIPGLAVVGSPSGPVFAVAADPDAPDAVAVDPHLWAAAVGQHGFTLQLQPSFTQSDGTVLPRSAHLTVTPVTGDVLDELEESLVTAADTVRGQNVPPVRDVEAAVTALVSAPDGTPPDMVTVLQLLESIPKPLAASLLIAYLESAVA